MSPLSRALRKWGDRFSTQRKRKGRGREEHPASALNESPYKFWCSLKCSVHLEHKTVMFKKNHCDDRHTSDDRLTVQCFYETVLNTMRYDQLWFKKKLLCLPFKFMLPSCFYSQAFFCHYLSFSSPEAGRQYTKPLNRPTGKNCLC